MAFAELELARINRALGGFMKKHRPLPHIRRELDLKSRVVGQSIELFEVRPAWRGAPGETMENPIAKIRFVRTQRLWQLFWMRQDLKWHGYEPAPVSDSLEQALAVVSEDSNACFFG